MSRSNSFFFISNIYSLSLVHLSSFCYITLNARSSNDNNFFLKFLFVCLPPLIFVFRVSSLYCVHDFGKESMRDDEVKRGRVFKLSISGRNSQHTYNNLELVFPSFFDYNYDWRGEELHSGYRSMSFPSTTTK